MRNAWFFKRRPASPETDAPQPAVPAASPPKQRPIKYSVTKADRWDAKFLAGIEAWDNPAGEFDQAVASERKRYWQERYRSTQSEDNNSAPPEVYILRRNGMSYLGYLAIELEGTRIVVNSPKIWAYGVPMLLEAAGLTYGPPTPRYAEVPTAELVPIDLPTDTLLVPLPVTPSSEVLAS